MSRYTNRFNPTKFLNELARRDKSTKILPQGVFIIADAYFSMESNAVEINFDSFSRSEMDRAFEDAMSFVTPSDIEESEEFEDRLYGNFYNTFHEYLRATENVGSIINTTRKQFPAEDDFI